MRKSGAKTPQPPLRIAVDTGGTFTDCVWQDRGRLRMLKVFSTPEDPSLAIADAINQLAPDGATVVLHGTTVGTNTLLQRKGARVAFVTTAGFEDTIEIGRQNRPNLYDPAFARTPPLVERGMRFGVPERVAPTGKILQKPSRDDLQLLARDVHASGAQSIAVSTLFSFVNPENERAVVRILEELGLPLSSSHMVLPEFREYERASTVVINAYLQPVMQTYLQRLDVRLQQIGKKAKASRIFVMQSNGGITSLEAASRQPARTVLSGPAGGVVGAAAMARLGGFARIITFDMGGTSTDVALIDGEPKATNEAEIAGLPIRLPMLDIHTVGAGGGSLAQFDTGGALRVGPESAGADPGPICYGRGVQPTVTDANLLLGRLQPDKFLGGSFALDLERTREITAAWLEQQGYRMSLERFAEGVVRVANARMERALRGVSVERGYDPRQFTLVAFGGAGGLHACELAQALGIQRVIVPAMPGALSACGILASDIVKDYSRTIALNFDARSIPGFNRRFEELEDAARREFHQEGWRGKLKLERSADLRYRGQGYELNIPWSKRSLDDLHIEHRRRYGYDRPEQAVELVTVRVRARLSTQRNPHHPKLEPGRAAVAAETRRAWFSGKLISVAVLDRGQMTVKRVLRGPAIVAEYSATTVIPSRSSFWLDSTGNLVIESRKKQKAPR